MKTTQISKELFIKNRSKLKELLLPGSCVIIFGADFMPRNGDQFHKFRQNSNFFYLTGINQEKSILIMNPWHPEKNNREILFVLKATPEMETWNGHKLTKEEASELSGVRNVQWLDEYESKALDIVYRSKNIYLDSPENPKMIPGVETRENILNRKVQRTFPLHAYHRLAPLMQRLRSIKEQDEIQLVQKACGITRDSFYRVLSMVRPGMPEYEVEAEITHEFIKRGASGHAYDPIIASGKDACILHYTDNNKVMRDGDLLLMDFGAEWGNYAADCTRTIPVSGKFSQRQAEVYDGLLNVFYEAKSMMIPGIKMDDFHQKVCKMMEQLHIRLGLYSKEDVEKYEGEKGLWFRYYMHGTSHSIGLDVHDTFDKYESFAPGMIFTCEPGIYIEDEEIGIRLENDLLITSEGNQDLMSDIPVERKEIEEIMQA